MLVLNKLYNIQICFYLLIHQKHTNYNYRAKLNSVKYKGKLKMTTQNDYRIRCGY